MTDPVTESSSGSSGGAKFTDEIDLDEDIDKTLHIKVGHTFYFYLYQKNILNIPFWYCVKQSLQSYR